jgi:hypothetical protein
VLFNSLRGQVSKGKAKSGAACLELSRIRVSVRGSVTNWTKLLGILTRLPFIEYIKTGVVWMLIYTSMQHRVGRKTKKVFWRQLAVLKRK